MAGRSHDVSPAYGAAAVVAAATLLPKGTCRSLYIATGGDVTGTLPSGDTLTFTNVPEGIFTVQFTIVSACPAGTIALY